MVYHNLAPLTLGICMGAKHAEDSNTCVIDLKTENPQLHYYTEGTELKELFDKGDLATITRYIDDHFSSSKLLAITGRSTKLLTVQKQIKPVIEFIGDLISILAQRGISVIAITNPMNCPIKSYLDKQSIVNYIVTDTNIAKAAQINNLAKLSLMNQKLKLRILVVTKCNSISPNSFLTKAGVQTNRFTIKSVPDLPIDLYKLQKAIYSQTNPWNY